MLSFIVEYLIIILGLMGLIIGGYVHRDFYAILGGGGLVVLGIMILLARMSLRRNDDG